MISFMTEILDSESDKDKLQLLYKCFRKQLFYVANSALNDKDKAEDVVHDTYMVMSKYLDKIDDEVYQSLNYYLENINATMTLTEYENQKNKKLSGKAWGYLVSILKCKIYMQYKIDNKIDFLSINDLEESSSDDASELMENNYEKKEIKEFLIKTLHQMKHPYKEVLYLKYFNELSSEEIGKIMGKTADNVRQIAKRGRDRLKNKLKEGGYDGFLY